MAEMYSFVFGRDTQKPKKQKYVKRAIAKSTPRRAVCVSEGEGRGRGKEGAEGRKARRQTGCKQRAGDKNEKGRR